MMANTRFTFVVEATHDGDPDDIAGVVAAHLPRLFREAGATVWGWSAATEPVER